MNLKIFEYVYVTYIRWIKTEILKFRNVLFLTLKSSHQRYRNYTSDIRANISKK